MKKAIVLIVITNIICLSALIGCGFSAKMVRVPEEKLTANYEKMFETAIAAGAGLGYHPEYQDKNTGIIKLLHKVGSTEYRITVQFGKFSSGESGFSVNGEAGGDIINPFIGGDVKKIEDAIMKVVEK